MTLFIYKAIDNQGKKIEAYREATDEKELIQHLQLEGFLPIKVTPVGSNPLHLLKLGKSGSKLAQKDVLLFTGELATLLNAGLPLDKSLLVLMDLAEDRENLKQIINKVLEKVKGGATLADALNSQANTFSKFYLNMVRAGEMGGNLEDVLTRLAEYLERSKELKDTVGTALIYPAILLIMSVASLFIMLTFVVPQFTEMFESAGKELPVSTQIVVATADFLQSYWWALVAGITLLAAFFNYQMIDPGRKKNWDKRFLAMPLVGDIILNMETANMSRTMGTLLGNGVSIIASLTIVQETIGNLELAAAVAKAEQQLKQGGSMSDAMLEGGGGQFPKLALQMMKMGEETGRLEEMLLRVASIYDKQLRVAIQRMLALLEPVLIISLGVLIAGIIASILMAILSVNDLAF